jgi:hypothetical protein
MIQKLLLVTIVLIVGISAAAGCGMVETPAKTEPRPANTPPVNVSTSEPEGRKQINGLWRQPVLAEAIETKLALESADYPRRDLIDLTLRLNDPDHPIPEVVREEPWGFEIGDRHLFWVLNWDTGENYQVTAGLIYKTAHAYLFVEEGLDLDQDKVKALAGRFEQNIYPTNRAFFGEEWSPGVDNDPRLTILFASDFGDFVGGYQRSMDEYSTLVYRYSNEMEILYMSPQGAWWNDDCTLAHEFEHVIQWAVDRDEAIWLNEGFSVFACQLNEVLPAGIGGALGAFAGQPDMQLNSWSGEADQALAEYGASYLFLVYLLDHFGQEVIRALAAEQANGLESVDEVLKSLDTSSSADDAFADWLVANAINDPSLDDDRYGYSSHDPFPVVFDAEFKAGDLPVERQTNVGQYAADYILIHGQGQFQVDFAGDTLVGLAPTLAHSGKYAWWGGRGANCDTTLTREFDLNGLQKATLSFNAWYDIEEDFDYAYVEASVDGRHWMTLPGQKTTNDDPSGVNYGYGYTGVSEGWIQEVVDLTPYVGQKVQIRFEYLTDDGPVQAGFFLDDIRIPELEFSDDAETGDGGWKANGFIRNAMVLPQEWLLQMVTQGEKQMTVEQLQLESDNSGSWSIELGPEETTVLIISGLARVTTEPADYWYKITNR